MSRGQPSGGRSKKGQSLQRRQQEEDDWFQEQQQPQSTWEKLLEWAVNITLAVAIWLCFIFFWTIFVGEDLYAWLGLVPTDSSSSWRQYTFVNDTILEELTKTTPHNYKASRNALGLNLPNYVQSIVHAEVPPKVCPETVGTNNVVMGYDDWHTLREAMQWANALSAMNFLRWQKHLALEMKRAEEKQCEGSAAGKEGSSATKCSSDGAKNAASSEDHINDDSVYYEEDVVLTICPNAVLRSTRGPPLYINGENIVLECEHCTIEVGGTHLVFGPYAKNFLARGIAFTKATTSSITMHHDGAQATFEDSLWKGNLGTTKIGAVVDVNSSSSIAFHRCEIVDTRSFFGFGQGVSKGPSLSIRN